MTVKLIDQSDPTNVWNLNIIDISNESGNKYLVVKYGGAYSGTYTLQVHSQTEGNFANPLTFHAVGKVTSFRPNIGSAYGGTLITIFGYNFSRDAITDNPVRVGYTDCLVESSSNEIITCRTLPRMEGPEEDDDDLIVFLKVSEEAEMDMENRRFNWTLVDLP